MRGRSSFYLIQVYALLEQYRIGNLSRADIVKEDNDDPYINDPPRHPVFHINNPRPFNAEPPLNILADNFITPKFASVPLLFSNNIL